MNINDKEFIRLRYFALESKATSWKDTNTYNSCFFFNFYALQIWYCGLRAFCHSMSSVEPYKQTSSVTQLNISSNIYWWNNIIFYP